MHTSDFPLAQELVHPDNRELLKKFIDFIRGEKYPDNETMKELQQMVQRHYPTSGIGKSIGEPKHIISI